MASPYTTDTSAETEELQLTLWRSMSGQARIHEAVSLSLQLRNMAFEAINRRHPDFSEDQIRLKFIELTYGKQLAAVVAAPTDVSA